MANLNPDSREVETRLTTLGRKKLLDGEGLGIVQFVLSDDEINYQLPDSDIEDTPLTAPARGETETMRRRIIRGTDEKPIIEAPSNIDISSENFELVPATTFNSQVSEVDQNMGYTFVLYGDNPPISVSVQEEPSLSDATIPRQYSPTVRVGLSFLLSKTSGPSDTWDARLIGNETGASTDFLIQT